jgi:hypothetical protein
MLMIFPNDSTLGEVFKGSLVPTLLHEQQLFSIPFIEIGGFDKRVHDTILTMLACTVDTEMDSQVDG